MSDELGQTTQSVWNFDGEELYVISSLKKDFLFYLKDWNLEEAYWRVRNLRMEFDAKLSRGNKKEDRIIADLEQDASAPSITKKTKAEPKKTEKQEVDEKLKAIDKIRTEYNNGKDREEDKVNYFEALEQFYMDLCYLMKRHGLYFREGEDMRLAVLRR